VPTTEGPEEPN